MLKIEREEGITTIEESEGGEMLIVKTVYRTMKEYMRMEEEGRMILALIEHGIDRPPFLFCLSAVNSWTDFAIVGALHEYSEVVMIAWNAGAKSILFKVRK